MKRIYSFILFVILTLLNFSCNPKLRPGPINRNQEAKDIQGNPMLLGVSTRERLEQEPYGSWFNANYSDYTVDTLLADQLKPKLVAKQFLIFMGTWCGDSRREVPRMYKLLDYCGVSPSQIRLVTLSSLDSDYKQSPGHEERGLNIHRVPDILVFSGKKELGRIVESPVVSLERDLFAIATGTNYSPNYQLVSFLADLFHKRKISSMEKNLNELAGQAKQRAVNSAELNTYGYVLLAAHEPDKAALVFKLNTLLFPAVANTYLSLADYYIQTGNSGLAIDNIRKALVLQPGNQEAKKKLKQLNEK